MPREATLFEEAGGRPLDGFFLLKNRGGNLPPRWIENAKASRKRRQRAVVAALKKARWGDIATLRDWEHAYKKECFYNGIRVLFELERDGRSNR